ncbi:MAG TPA: molybdopterin-dependent oxidoreductase [Intrasporangiaceae bacterium]|nr:molybdopterin-dependent oxidoreductase [Intrasporangiaceae bacterium]
MPEPEPSTEPTTDAPVQTDPEAENTSAEGPRRRSVLAGTAAGVAGAAAIGFMWRDGFGDPFTQPTAHGTGPLDDAYEADDVIYSMCMQCNTFCTIKVRLTESPDDVPATSLVRKIAGNPYSPLTTQPIGPIPYDTTPEHAVRGIGNMARDAKSRSGGIACLKGQAGIQVVHDAKRITAPLKRVGERGSGKWVSITWEEALRDILDGSDLGTPGLREWWAYAPQEPVMADWEKVTSGEMTQDEFTAAWGDKLIDPTRPELGPKSNLFAMIGGDRMYLMGQRFGLKSLGTINQFNHGGTCGVTGVVANAQSHPTSGFQRMYADIDYCRYLIVWGTEPLTAQKGPTWLAPRIGKAREHGMKMVVIDPRMSKTAEKADTWVPVKPGHDAELAFALVRWIIDNERYDERYLRAPGAPAAEAIGEPTWTDATHLIKVDDPRRQPLSLLDLGLAEDPGTDEDGKPIDPERAVLVDGQIVGADTTIEQADLYVDTEIAGPEGPIRVRSVFAMVTERVRERSVEEYATAAGVDVGTVEQIGTDFTSHGKQAVVMSYRGPAMHSNGFRAIQAINYLNFLVGNHDWKGGHMASERKFAPMMGRYDLTAVPGANKAWGIPITREKTRYEQTSFFEEDGYPAKRRWYPFPGNLCHEVIPSAAQGYPYSLNALFMHRHSPLNSSPGAHRQARDLQDTEKIKLVVCFETTIGDTAVYADYILPDVTYLERFSHESVYPSQQYRLTQLGQPTTRAFEGPRPVEEFYLELAKEMGLPGVGTDAFGPGAHFDTYEDYWLKMAANTAFAGDNPVPDASAEEQELFVRTREKALGAHFDEARWKAAVTEEEWPKVVYVLNRGGRFDGHDKGYEGDWLLHRYAGMCAFYANKVATAKDSYSGESFDGLAYIDEPRRFDGSPLPKSGPLIFSNWKSRHQGTYRTVNSAWLREVRPSNFVWVNSIDARARGIETGDRVRITSGSGEAEGVAMVIEGIRPGVIGAESAFGHRRGYFSEDIEIDGEVVRAAKAYGHARSFEVTPMHEETGFGGDRAEGFPVNFLVDEDVTGAGGVTDPVGGGAAQLLTWVELTKV